MSTRKTSSPNDNVKNIKRIELTKHEESVFKKLHTPARIQDFLNGLKNENIGERLHSPRYTLQTGEAHCMEGALLAAALLWYHGHEPLLMDLKTTTGDFDHVLALFRHAGRWGAITKTNHAVLRYREPVYRSYHELAMSYFHEYFLDNGKKTMRAYSRPFRLASYGTDWVTAERDLWDIGADLDDSPHVTIAPPAVIRAFRKADSIEIAAGKLIDTTLIS